MESFVNYSLGRTKRNNGKWNGLFSLSHDKKELKFSDGDWKMTTALLHVESSEFRDIFFCSFVVHIISYLRALQRVMQRKYHATLLQLDPHRQCLHILFLYEWKKKINFYNSDFHLQHIFQWLGMVYCALHLLASSVCSLDCFYFARRFVDQIKIKLMEYVSNAQNCFAFVVLRFHNANSCILWHVNVSSLLHWDDEFLFQHTSWVKWVLSVVV